MEVLQGGRVIPVIALQVLPVHACGAAVDEGFLLCAQVLAANQLLAQGQHKFGFQDDGVCAVAVIPVHVHGVDVVRGGGGNMDDLAAHRLDQRRILALGINQDYIVVAGKYLIDDFSLGGEALAGAGYS